eukprot:4391349-Pyramimonas_sp.AAC.1
MMMMMMMMRRRRRSRRRRRKGNKRRWRRKTSVNPICIKDAAVRPPVPTPSFSSFCKNSLSTARNAPLKGDRCMVVQFGPRCPCARGCPD